MAQRKLGRLPNDPSKRRIRLTARTAPQGFTPPAKVDYFSKVPASTWGMDGNDTVGDCTCADVDHRIKAMQVAAGNTEVKSSAQECLAAYSAITGYDPRNPNSDQGAVMQDVANYWRTSGFTLGGKPDKILLFAEVDISDLNLVKWCVDQFGAVGVGFNFPASAMTQFDDGQPWDVVRSDGGIEGGHAVALVGYDATYLYCVSWGQVQKMTPAFWAKYVEEAWTQLSSDFVNSVSGEDPLAGTLYDLGQQFQQVTGQPNPFPAPQPQPTPTPTPTPSPVPPDPSVVATLQAALRRFLGTKECPAYLRSAAEDWLG